MAALGGLLLIVQPEGGGEDVAGAAAVLGNQHVVKHRLGLPQPDILERAGHAHLGDFVRRGREGVGVLPRVLALVELFHLALGIVLNDLLLLEPHRPVRGLVHAGDHVERRGLARAVGTDQGHDLPLVDLQVQVIHRHHAAELHGDVFNLQHLLAHW